MAFFKDRKVLEECDQTYFDKELLPGTPTHRSGIYRCDSCGFEIVLRHSEMLPQIQVCDGHDIGSGWESPPSGRVKWHLVVLAHDRKINKA